MMGCFARKRAPRRQSTGVRFLLFVLSISSLEGYLLLNSVSIGSQNLQRQDNGNVIEAAVVFVRMGDG